MRRLLLAAAVLVPVGALFWFLVGRDVGAGNTRAPGDVAVERDARSADGTPGNAAPLVGVDADNAQRAEPKVIRADAALPAPAAKPGPDQIRVHGTLRASDGGPLGTEALVRVRWLRLTGSKRGVGASEVFAAVASNGTFEAFVPKAARTLRIGVVSDFLALERDLRVPRPNQEPLVLEATRGGCIVLDFQGGAGADARAEPLETESFGSNGFVLAAVSTQGEETITRRPFRAEDGSVRFGGLPPHGAWTVSLKAVEYANLRQVVPAVEALTYATCVLDVTRGAGVSGWVRDEGGEPMGNVNLTLRTWESSDTRYDFGREVQGRSGEDGSFTLRGALPGNASILAEPDGLLTKVTKLGPVADGELREGIEIRLDRGGVLGGRAVFEDGEPADGVRVSVVDAKSLRFEVGHDSTDRDGRFSVSGLSGTRYVVTAVGRRNHRGPHLRASVETAGSGNVKLVLGRGLGLLGRVVDDRGEGVPDYRLSAKPVGRAGEELHMRFRSESGEFEFTGLAEGAWDVEVRAKDHGVVLPRRVELPGIGDTLEFMLHRYGQFSGVLVGPGGAPVEGAEVSIAALRVDTDAEGRFAFESVPPGQQRVEVKADGYGPLVDPFVHVEPGLHVKDHTLKITRGARVLGRVHPDRWTGAERGVLLRRAGKFAAESAPIDEKGHFRYEGLAPGSYLVRLDLAMKGPWFERFADSLEVPVEVPADTDVEVVIGDPATYGITVHGLVRRGGEPAPGLLMYVYKTDEETQMPRQIARTDDEGRFEIPLRQSGLHSFCVGKGQAKQVRFEIVVTEEARQRRDLDLPNRSLAGRARLDDGSPASGQMLLLVHADVPSDVVMVGHTAFATASSDGTFEFTDLHPGTYRLRTGNYINAHPTRGLVVVEDIVVPEEGDAEELDLFLPEGAVVDVRAVDASGRGLTDRRVDLLDPRGRHGVLWSSKRTDAQGWLRATGIGPGRWEVVVLDRDKRVTGRGELEVQPGGRAEATVVCE